DYDLFLVNATSGAILASSENSQTGTQPPSEGLSWFNPGPGSIPVGFAIRDFNKAAGLPSTTPRMDVWMWPPVGGLVNLQYSVAAGSVLSPAYVSSSMAVAAVCWQNNRLESYSSQGPLFDGRIKP